MSNRARINLPDASGHFGPYGGMFVPEKLMTALQDLKREYHAARKDPEFRKELAELLADFCGRPKALYFAERLTDKRGGAKIYLQREERLPDPLVACVGGGSKAIGFFYPFLGDESVKMTGVEAGGDGILRGRHAARFQGGKLGVLQGTKDSLLIANLSGRGDKDVSQVAEILLKDETA